MHISYSTIICDALTTTNQEVSKSTRRYEEVRWFPLAMNSTQDGSNDSFWEIYVRVLHFRSDNFSVIPVTDLSFPCHRWIGRGTPRLRPWLSECNEWILLATPLAHVWICEVSSRDEKWSWNGVLARTETHNWIEQKMIHQMVSLAFTFFLLLRWKSLGRGIPIQFLRHCFWSRQRTFCSIHASMERKHVYDELSRT